MIKRQTIVCVTFILIEKMTTKDTKQRNTKSINN